MSTRLTWCPSAARVSRAREEVRCSYDVHVERLRTTDRALLVHRATTDLERVVALVTDRLRLSPPPPLPVLGAPPAEVPDTYGGWDGSLPVREDARTDELRLPCLDY